MLWTRTLISVLTLGACTLAQTPKDTIPAGRYTLQLHQGREILYAAKHGGTVVTSTKMDRWFIRAVDSSGQGYTIQNVASGEYAQGSQLPPAPITLSATKSLWGFNATTSRSSIPGPFAILDVRSDTLVWTAQAVGPNSTVIVDTNKKNPATQVWYLVRA